MIAKFALATMLLTSSVNAFAMSDAQLAQAMRSDMEKYMSTIKAEKYIFHWVDASDINPPRQYDTRYAPTAEHYKAYVEKQGRRIYNNRRSGDSDIEGPGLYMASDPMVSRAYGGSRRYGLIVGKLRVGAKVVTGSGAGLDLTIAADIRQEIAARGCSAASYTAILDTFNRECSKVKQLLVGRDASFADGRIYSWGQAMYSDCYNRDIRNDVIFPSAARYHDTETFVVYNKNLFSEIYGFTHQSVPGNNAEANEILSYLKGIEESTRRDILPDLQMDNDAIRALSRTQIEKFIEKNILGCGEN